MQDVDQNNIVNSISPAEYCQSTGTVSFWDCKRHCGRINETVPFNISTASFEPRNNDEVKDFQKNSNFFCFENEKPKKFYSVKSKLVEATAQSMYKSYQVCG